jgi:eukaryotic-like serine/threonine-protein kinase
MNCPQCTTANPDFAENCSHCGTPMPISDSATIRMVDPTALSVGSDFGTRYRIEALLGQGGMGRVYKAYDKTLDRMVALKVVRQGMMADNEALSRFKQELLLASKVSHTNILRIHDMGEVGEVKFITMAFVDGPDLHHILQSSKLPFERVVSFSQQLAAALAAAQAEGVIHRDLKPQNILVGKDDHLYVSDFGLAKTYEENAIQMTRTGAFLGTPRYMSPEQVEGKPADMRSDIYAYGLILYEMVTGDVPFTGESTLKVMYQRIQEKPKNPKTLNPELPNWFAQVVMRCLERDPQTRYQKADEILLDLQGARSTVSTVRVGGGATRTVQIQIPEFRDKRWIWGIVGVAALFIAAFAVPQVRHMIFGGKAGKTETGGISGVPPVASGRYVAVLPLQVLGDPSQLNYLAEGIQDALSTKLFQMKDIHVTSSDAAARVDQKQSLEKIGAALGANMIVQGTLQGSGDKIRIILKLEDVTSGKDVWSQQFDGVTGDLFTLEDEIYGPLTSALNLNPTNEELAKAEQRPTENVAAYDLYLRGRNALRGDDVKSIEAALDFFNQSLSNDRTFALAYTGIADSSLRMYQVKRDSLWTQKALAAAQQAQQLNDQLPEVHSTLGAVYQATGKYTESISELNRALALSPNSDDIYRGLGHVYLASGNGPQAIQAFQKAVSLNPYFWDNQNSLGGAYFQLGDYQKALEAFTQVTVLEPNIGSGYENVGNVYLQQGKYQESVPYLQKSLQIEPYYSTYSNLGTAFFFLKQYSNSADMFEKAVALSPNSTEAMVNLADAYRAGGQADKAHTAYQQAIALGYKELETNPRDATVMGQVALAYAKNGDAQNATSLIKRTRAMDKNDVNYVYEEAVIDALLGRTADSLKALDEALAKHYPAQFASGDPDLGSLQANPQFQALIKKYSQQKP